MLWWWEKGVGGKGWQRRPTTQAHFIFGLRRIGAGEWWKGMKPDETDEKRRSSEATLWIYRWKVWEKHKQLFSFFFFTLSWWVKRVKSTVDLRELCLWSIQGPLNLVLIGTLKVSFLSALVGWHVSLLTVKWRVSVLQRLILHKQQPCTTNCHLSCRG